jgi:AcrR family transcriptional regulator
MRFVSVEHSPGLLGPFQDRAPGLPAVPGEGLRERKKRLTRQLISDTATMMFLDRGFEEVRVTEVAAACNVSEQTVYNYFPTKESLVLDREVEMTAALRRVLGPGGALMSPVDAAVGLITAELNELWDQDRDQPLDLGLIHRFLALLERTPALRAAQHDMMERLAQVAAQAMAARAGVDPHDPEPQIAAEAILSLWKIQFSAIEKYTDGTRTPTEVRERVISEVYRAARLIETGLWSFGIVVQGAHSREQLRTAVEAAKQARKKVAAAIKQAREAWTQATTDPHR